MKRRQESLHGQELDKFPASLIFCMLIVWLYCHQTEGSQSQYRGLLGVNNMLLGDREVDGSGMNRLCRATWPPG